MLTNMVGLEMQYTELSGTLPYEFVLMQARSRRDIAEISPRYRTLPYEFVLMQARYRRDIGEM